MSERVPVRLRELVSVRANSRCEYCLCPADYSTDPFEVDHITPTTRGGKADAENLAFACSGCNGHKYQKMTARDPVLEAEVPLYHPRTDGWQDHFSWSPDQVQIVGLTPIGRATVSALQLNRMGVVNLRKALYRLGLHPPPADK